MTDRPDNVAYELGVLTGAVRQLALDLATNRREGHDREARILGRIEQHDQRDDDRFVAVGARLLTIERKIGIQDALDASHEQEAARDHDRRNVIHGAFIGFIAALLGGAIAGGLALLGGH